MINFAQNLIFLDECVKIRDFEFLNSLDCHPFQGKSVLGPINNPKTTMSHILLKVIVIFDVSLARIEKQPLVYFDILIDPLIDQLFLSFFI